MKIILHQTNITIGDLESSFQEIESCLQEGLSVGSSSIHIFPELFLGGYPLQDLCLQKSFISAYQNLIQRINQLAIKLKPTDNKILVMGGLKYELNDSGTPVRIYNGIYKLTPGSELEWVATKQLLPNYDIFDERKYYHPGESTSFLQWKGLNIALLVCEDMWPSTFYDHNPVQEICDLEERIHLIVNVSASPFHIGKQKKRFDRAKQISKLNGAPFVYVNKVGGEDEIMFDGNSFIVHDEKILAMAKSFEKDVLEFDLEIPFQEDQTKYKSLDQESTSAWEDLFAPNLILDKKPIRLKPLQNQDLEELIEAMGFGVHEYARKNGFKNYSIALSGGLDSALVLTVLKLTASSDQKIEAIYMPGQYSAGMSYDLSNDLCKKLNVEFHVLPIKFLHSTVKNIFQSEIESPLQGLADENIQSRLRGALIYARSNQMGSMVVNTSNKSELAVGYSTQYGDSVGAVSMLGDLYKSEIFTLAKYINRTRGNLIPEGIITRPPSAELRADQKDTDSLPPYEELDAILEGILSYRLTPKELIDGHLPAESVNETLKKYRNSEYKRSQFCPIIKLRSKSFGFGYRNPLSRRTDFYFSN